MLEKNTITPADLKRLLIGGVLTLNIIACGERDPENFPTPHFFHTNIVLFEGERSEIPGFVFPMNTFWLRERGIHKVNLNYRLVYRSVGELIQLNYHLEVDLKCNPVRDVYVWSGDHKTVGETIYACGDENVVKTERRDSSRYILYTVWGDPIGFPIQDFNTTVKYSAFKSGGAPGEIVIHRFGQSVGSKEHHDDYYLDTLRRENEFTLARHYYHKKDRSVQTTRYFFEGPNYTRLQRLEDRKRGWINDDYIFIYDSFGELSRYELTQPAARYKVSYTYQNGLLTTWAGWKVDDEDEFTEYMVGELAYE